MNWNTLISPQRYGIENISTVNKATERTQFQRDYDRLIFSSAFRRLQDKTQIFPLPGSIFVHNRLTHSLEVASVGRSLGAIIGSKLRATDLTDDKEITHEFGNIVAAACLAHDLGNPPFGHCGESAISHYFKQGKGRKHKTSVTPEQWKDISNFEGNANTLRILTHQFKGRREGGFALTYTTLASTIKYPFSSTHKTQSNKYGYFNTEHSTYQKIVKKLQLKEKVRHPLVYLVEAADDICYLIMDIEDAHKLQILTTQETKDILFAFLETTSDKKLLSNIEKTLTTVSDTNEQITYLRAKIIGKLVNECSNIFWEKHKHILQGTYNNTLVDDLKGTMQKAMQHAKELSNNKIYNHSSVIEIEISGYKILSTLLDEFIDAILSPHTHYTQMLLTLIPHQYTPITDKPYDKIQSILDFISGMTDIYALKLYRKIKGLDLSRI